MTSHPGAILAWFRDSLLFSVLSLSFTLFLPNHTLAQTFKVIYSFPGQSGAYFPTSLVPARNGDIYGTALGGTTLINGGSVFKINHGGLLSILYSFCQNLTCSDGSQPNPGLVFDKYGSVYGTTVTGGIGVGTIFKIDPAGNETVIYNFQGAAAGDGAYPAAGLIWDAEGDLYGTTSAGGLKCTFDGEWQKYGCGTVFKLRSSGQEVIEHRFRGLDGLIPLAGLVRDASGISYGSTSGGGTNDFGTIYQIGNDGAESVIYNFPSGMGDDGYCPGSGLIIDPAGNLLGTTDAYTDHPYVGTVFRMRTSGEETILAGVNTGGGCDYAANVTLDSEGNIYGVSYDGGDSGQGAIFEIDTSGNLRTLYSFTGGPDGAYPYATLVRDSMGNLFGTTFFGGARVGPCQQFGCGVIFEITP